MKLVSTKYTNRQVEGCNEANKRIQKDCHNFKQLSFRVFSFQAITHNIFCFCRPGQIYLLNIIIFIFSFQKKGSRGQEVLERKDWMEQILLNMVFQNLDTLKFIWLFWSKGQILWWLKPDQTQISMRPPHGELLSDSNIGKSVIASKWCY